MANHIEIESCSNTHQGEKGPAKQPPPAHRVFRINPYPDSVVIDKIYRDVSPITRDSPSIPVPSDYDERLPNDVLQAVVGSMPRRPFRDLP